MTHVERAMDLPPASDFVLSAGFAGLVALLATIIVSCAILLASRRANKRSRADRDLSERQHLERRDDSERAIAIARCWDRWWQVVETAALEPTASEGASLGLGPEVTLVLLRALLRDAEELGDDTLATAIATYQEQLLLVLAQQSGPLARLSDVKQPAKQSDPPPPRATRRHASDDDEGRPAPTAKPSPTAGPPAEADPGEAKTETLQASMLKDTGRRRRS